MTSLLRFWVWILCVGCIAANQYNYVWKTQSTYANKCFKFDLQLTDGTSDVADFKFLK